MFVMQYPNPGKDDFALMKDTHGGFPEYNMYNDNLLGYAGAVLATPKGTRLYNNIKSLDLITNIA